MAVSARAHAKYASLILAQLTSALAVCREQTVNFIVTNSHGGVTIPDGPSFNVVRTKPFHERIILSFLPPGARLSRAANHKLRCSA